MGPRPHRTSVADKPKPKAPPSLLLQSLQRRRKVLSFWPRSKQSPGAHSGFGLAKQSPGHTPGRPLQLKVSARQRFCHQVWASCGSRAALPPALGIEACVRVGGSGPVPALLLVTLLHRASVPCINLEYSKQLLSVPLPGHPVGKKLLASLSSPSRGCPQQFCTPLPGPQRCHPSTVGCPTHPFLCLPAHWSMYSSFPPLTQIRQPYSHHPSYTPLIPFNPPFPLNLSLCLSLVYLSIHPLILLPISPPSRPFPAFLPPVHLPTPLPSALPTSSAAYLLVHLPMCATFIEANISCVLSMVTVTPVIIVTTFWTLVLCHAFYLHSHLNFTTTHHPLTNENMLDNLS